MRLLFLLLLALVVAVLLGSLAGTSDGVIVMAVADYTVSTSMTFFVIALTVLILLSYAILRSITKAITLPEDMRRWRKHRHQRRAEKYLTQGLIHMTEGRWKLSENEFRRSAKYSRSPYINYLLAARAAQQQEASNRRDDYLRLAYQDNPDAALAVGITQAELQLNHQQNEQALATLKALHHKQPKQIQVKQLLMETCSKLEEWNSVLTLLPQLEKTGMLSKESVLSRQLDAYAGLLIEAGDKGKSDAINKIWHAIPAKLRKQIYLIDVYVTQRLRIDDATDCDELLRSVLKHNWDKALVRLYGLITAIDKLTQLSYMERFITDHAQDPVLLLTLGRLSIKNELWGKARNYLEESIKVEPNPEAYYELASLYDREGNKYLASECYQKGLALATNVKEPITGKQNYEKPDHEALGDIARQVV